MGGNVARVGQKKNAYRILKHRPEGKEPLGNLRCGWQIWYPLYTCEVLTMDTLLLPFSLFYRVSIYL